MKISSASKKVLASALSAAMVVAFAPTLAFAKNGDPVSVTVDVAGGTATTVAFPNAQVGQELTFDANAVSADGYQLNYWYVDANLDGEYNAADKDTQLTGNKLTLTDEMAQKGVTVRAVYKAAPVVASADVTEDATAKTASIKVALSDADSQQKANEEYTVSIKHDGATLGSKTFAKGEPFAAFTLSFAENPTVDQLASGAYAKYSTLTAGAYTIELSEGSKVISTKTVNAYTVTKVAADGKKATSKVFSGFDGKATVALGSEKYVDADGYIVTGDQTVSGDVTYKVASADEQALAPTLDYVDKVFTAGFTGAAADGTSYAVSVVAPDGTVAGSKSFTKATDLILSYDETDSYTKGAGSLQAGDYVATVVKTDKDGKTATAKTKLTITEFKVVAGDNVTLKDDAAKDVFQKNATTFVVPTESDVKSFADGYDFDEVELTVDGKVATAAQAGKVNIYTVKAKAVANTKIAAPTIASVTKALKKDSTTEYEYTIQVASATAGATLTYKVGAGSEAAVPATGIVVSEADFKANKSIEVKADKTVGVTDPVLTTASTATFTTVGSAANVYTTLMGSGDLEKYIGKTETKWYSAEGVKAAYDAGKKAIDEAYYATAEDWTKLVNDSTKAVYEAVAAEADAQLAPYKDEAFVKVGTSYVYVTAADYKKATDAVAKAVKDNVTDKKDTAASDYSAAISGIIAAVNTALTTDAKAAPLTAAEIEAAQAVKDQIEKLGTDYAEVTKDNYEAAATAAADVQTAYAALTPAQKAIVNADTDTQVISKVLLDAASVAAQVKDEEAAKKLADAQDQAAANLLTSKTVTAKAKVGKKAQGKSFTYKLAASESGAVATYTKTGSKYIKVSKSGKVTFSKVKAAKKAKTYKAKVTVTYGTQTATKTVTYKVKKK